MKGVKLFRGAVYLIFAIVFLLVSVQVEAGWLDAVKEQAEKAKTAAESLKQTLEGKPANENGSQSPPDQGQSASSTPVRQPPVAVTYDKNQLKHIQQQLNTLGYSVGAVDGVYGAGTKRKIAEFQQDHGLPADGVPTPALSARLDAEVRSSGATANSVASASGTQVSSAVTVGGFKPINPERVKGMPLLESSVNGMDIETQRLLTMLVINADPGLLTPPAGWPKSSSNCFGNIGSYECMIARVVYDNFDTSVTEKYFTRVKTTVIWRSRDEFQLRKDQQAVVDTFVPQLKKAASSYSFPMRIVLKGTAVPGQYDFDKQAFPLQHTLLWGDPPNFTFPVVDHFYDKLYLPTFEAPKRMSIEPGKAEALRARLAPKGMAVTMPGFSRSANVLYTIELQGASKGAIRGEVKSIELYAPEDKTYASPLYAFNNAAFNKTEAVVAATARSSWDASINWKSSNAGMPDERYFLSTYAVLNGAGQSTIKSIVNDYVNETIKGGTPFERQKKQNDVIQGFDKDEMGGLASLMKSFNQDEMVVFPAEISLQEYNLKTGQFPVRNIDIASPLKNFRSNNPEFTKQYPVYTRVRVNLAEQPKYLSVPADVAEKLYKQSTMRSGADLWLPVRIKAHAVKNRNPGYNQTGQYVDVVVSYVIDEIEILNISPEIKSARNRHLTLVDKIKHFNPGWVIWSYSVSDQRARAAVAAESNEQKARENAAAAAAAAAKEKQQYAGKFNILGASIGMDITQADTLLAGQFKGKQVSHYSTSPNQVADLMEEYGIDVPPDDGSMSTMTRMSSDASNADSLANSCKMQEQTRLQMSQMNPAMAQKMKVGKVTWNNRQVSCDEMSVIAGLMINRTMIRQDALHTAKAISVDGSDFIALYSDDGGKVVAMYRQIHFPKESAPPVEALMKNLETKYGQAAIKPRGAMGGKAVWLLPTTRGKRAEGCALAFKNSPEAWFNQDVDDSVMKEQGLEMTVTGLDNSIRLAGGECSEAVIVEFYNSVDGLYLKQTVLADQGDLKPVLPPLVKSSAKAVAKLEKSSSAPAADVKF